MSEKATTQKVKKFQITLEEKYFNLVMASLLDYEKTKDIGVLLYLNAKEIK